PYYAQPNQDLFVHATLYSTEPNLVLFTDTCVVSPNPHDFTTVASDLVRRGCVRDPTCGNYYSPGKRTVQFKFRAPIYPRVCLRCKILACNRYNYFSQRYQGYMRRGKRSTND
ncbi:DMBT1 protein, partial [Mesembrinibis cayennensis]|nr:DMBT1 protein [Mesembrinibis cayennensis]